MIGRACSDVDAGSDQSNAVRLVSWNIRAGGGYRAADIVGQILAWRADIVALSEFRGTPPSRGIASALAAAGLRFQRTTAAPAHAAVNALLVAARWPLRSVRLDRAPTGTTRWLHVNVAAPVPFAVMALHVPNRSSGRKYPFLDSVADVAERWRGGPALIVGDTNSGRIGVDETSPAFNRIEDRWIATMARHGWPDFYRAGQPDGRDYTWYSPNGGNGFRLDQAFVNTALADRVRRVAYRWGGADTERRDRLSDHAALVVDLA